MKAIRFPKMNKMSLVPLPCFENLQYLSGLVITFQAMVGKIVQPKSLCHAKLDELAQERDCGFSCRTIDALSKSRRNQAFSCPIVY
jgi:hypothetical protein